MGEIRGRARRAYGQGSCQCGSDRLHGAWHADDDGGDPAGHGAAGDHLHFDRLHSRNAAAHFHRRTPAGRSVEPTYAGYSIGKWIDEDGDGRYDVLEAETRAFKGPRFFDGSGIPLDEDNESVIKERIYLDKTDRNLLRDEITVSDHALTRPWTVTKYRRTLDPRADWPEYICNEKIPYIHLDNSEVYKIGRGRPPGTDPSEPAAAGRALFTPGEIGLQGRQMKPKGTNLWLIAMPNRRGAGLAASLCLTFTSALRVRRIKISGLEGRLASHVFVRGPWRPTWTRTRQSPRAGSLTGRR